MPYVAPIVEGQGEVHAVPALLHRIFSSMSPAEPLLVNPPIRVKSANFVKDDAYLRKYVTLAMEKARARKGGIVLILLDCEDECPAKLGPTLLERARAVRDDVPVLVALAYREYETWFLAAAQSLRGVHGLPDTLDPPSEPEAIRDAKGWLGEYMPAGYKETTHQLEFTKRFDLDDASSVPSFKRFVQHIRTLLEPPFSSGSLTGD